MVVALVAIAGAFASNLSKQDNAALVDRQGHIRVGTQCLPTPVICTTDFGPVCSDGTNILYDWNGSSCPMPLYRKP